MNHMKMKNKKIVFDGQVYAQRITGQYRYADEILTELDKIIDKNEYEIVVPSYVDIDGKFKNINVIRYGSVKGILWSQTDFAIYLRKHHAIPFGFCNTTPIARRGIAVVHDIGYKVLKNYRKSFYGLMSSYWHRLNYWVIAKSNYPIVTVSEFSKRQIEEVYHVPSERIVVIGNGWQHYNRIEDDTDIFNEIPVDRNKYYFALGSLEDRKNFKWIQEVSKRNPDEMFVIAGGNVKNSKAIDFNSLKNICFVGFISDGKAKSLMRNCKAFLFPSTFEGFGIPPLEAMSVGADVLCANSSCLPEICGDAVRYFDPYYYDFELKKLAVIDNKESISRVLDKYSWEKSAKAIKALLDEQVGKYE